VRPSEDILDACHEATAYLMQYTDTDPNNPLMAFSGREEVCRAVYELDASSAVLTALCRYRDAAAWTPRQDRVRQETGPWIKALAEFLLFMQGEDGLFRMSYDAEDRVRTMPRGAEQWVARQAKAAHALCMAHKSVGMPRAMDAARRAVTALVAEQTSTGGEGRERMIGADDARWLALALMELAAAEPEAEYTAWLGDIASQRRQAQLTPEAAPAADLVGGTLTSFPPKAGPTANDLVVFTAACLAGAPEAEQNHQAARRAALYLMQLQYLPENSYYLPDPRAAEGGLREQPGGNIVRLQTMGSAIQGLAMLTSLELGEVTRDD